VTEVADATAATDQVSGEVAPRGGAAGVAGAGVAGQAIAFLTAPILARALGPSGRGTVALLGVYDELSTNLFNAGVPSAVGFALKERKASAAALLGATRRFNLFLLPVSIAAGIAVAVWPLAHLTTPARIAGFGLVALSPVANTYLIACRNVLMARGDMVTLRQLPLVQALVRGTAIVSLAMLGGMDPTVAAVCLSASVLVANALAWRRVHTRAGPPAPLRPLLGFGLRSLPGSLSNLANNRLDQILIAPMLGTRALGLYAVAVGITFVPVQVGAGLAYASFRHVRTGDLAGRRGTAAMLIRRAWLVTAAACVATGVASLLGLRLLYGDDFSSALTPTLLLLPSALFLGVHLVVTQVANALGAPEHASIGQIVGVAVTVIGLVIALPEHGIAGAAVVSSVAYAVRLGVTLVLLRRRGVWGTIPGPHDVTTLVRDLRKLVRRAVASGADSWAGRGGRRAVARVGVGRADRA
jgi:O-antigen/teichoic acid export membrane protein